MIEFNEARLFESFKDIYKTCINDGYPIPFRISRYDIPREYLFTPKELEEVLDNVSEGNREKLNSAYQNRRAEETEIFHNNIKTGKKGIFKKIEKYYDNELTDFIKKYPQYNDII